MRFARLAIVMGLLVTSVAASATGDGNKTANQSQNSDKTAEGSRSSKDVSEKPKAQKLKPAENANAPYSDRDAPVDEWSSDIYTPTVTSPTLPSAWPAWLALVFSVLALSLLAWQVWSQRRRLFAVENRMANQHKVLNKELESQRRVLFDLRETLSTASPLEPPSPETPRPEALQQASVFGNPRFPQPAPVPQRLTITVDDFLDPHIASYEYYDKLRALGGEARDVLGGAAGRLTLGQGLSEGASEIDLIAIDSGAGQWVVMPSWTYVRDFSVQHYKLGHATAAMRAAFDLQEGGAGGLECKRRCLAHVVAGELVVMQKGALLGYKP